MTRKTSQLEKQIALVRHERALAELRLQERKLAAAQQAERAVEALEAWSDLDYVDPRVWRTDADGREFSSGGIPAIGNAHDATASLASEQELAAARSMARLVTQTTCPGAGILETLANYVIGGGFKYQAVTKRGQDAPRQLLLAVQQVIDEFLDENDWQASLDRELAIRAARDGEFFLALYPRLGGRTEARVIEPEQITEPATPPIAEEDLHLPFATSWSWGIHTPAHDVVRTLGYNVRWDAAAGDEYLPAALVEHHKANVDRNVKRGVSDFFPAWQWLLRHERLARNTAEGATIQAAIAFVRQHVAGATRDQVEGVQRASADLSRPLRTPGGNRTVYAQFYEPGTIVDIPSGRQFLPGPMGAERGEAFLAVAAKLLRHVAARWNMPEYMISSDASNANFASTREAGTPFVGFILARQAMLRARFSRVLWRVLQNAATAGRLTRFGPLGSYAVLLDLVELQISPPEVVRTDPVAATQRRQILFQSGVLSKRTWQLEEGLEPEIEAKRLSEN